ncbi:MAG: complex I NDUFA9 subunit family protein [Hyphomicrobiaceae bacterium]|nr:complex I NDUFA9 subunit family protein [Hyphomicrobiaceae bacterium]
MNTRLEKGSLVTVLGGSGFIGRHVVRALARDGWRVRVAVRRPDLAGYLQPMGAVGQVCPVQANIRYPDSIRAAVAGAEAVVNLVAVLASSGAQSFDALHVKGAEAVAEAAKAAGASRLVHVSALGASPRSKSNYARSKAAGERAVLKAFPQAVILQPSLVFGPEDDLFNRFGRMAAMSPVLPLIGGGGTRFQPVYVGDVATAVARACAGAAEAGATYQLGGPEVVTFRQILDRVQAYSGRQRRYISVPFWAAKLGALLTLPLPSGLRPLTVDQVRLLQADNVVSAQAISEGHTLEGLGIAHPQTMAAVVPGYLERFNPHGQYAHYRG